MNKPTCGPLWRQALEAAKADTNDPLELFSWGHLCGHAEKVYLGACIAAMFRPNGDERRSFWWRINKIAEIYDLSFHLVTTERGFEFWLTRHECPHIDDLFRSPDDHALRGYLCGIPENEIDLEFDKRYEVQA